jgi:hypothetical protein
MVARRISKKDRPPAHNEDWERSKEVRIRASREKRPIDAITYRMAAAYVAGDYDGNYLHWISTEDRNPAVADKAIDRMLFVLEEVRHDPVLRGALVHYLMSDKPRRRD